MKELIGSNPIGNHCPATNTYDKRFLNAEKRARASGVLQSKKIKATFNEFKENNAYYSGKANQQAATVLNHAAKLSKSQTKWAPKHTSQWTEPKNMRMNITGESMQPVF